MLKIEKQHGPFLCLLGMTVVACFYYLNDGVWNDYGQTMPEWMLLVDGLLVLPLVCFFCIDDKQKAALKAIIYASLMVLVGSFLIPESNKYVWNYLESGRYVLLMLLVVFELLTILTVFFAIRSSLNKNTDPDSAISMPIESLVGKGKLATLMSFEARVWVYALFNRRVESSKFRGDAHFYGDLKDGTASNLLGFIVIIVFEIPLVHLLIHFIWSPFAANVITGLTILGLLFFVAEYRAISRRPVSIDASNQQLIIRYGLFAPLVIPFDQIKTITEHHEAVARAKNTKRFNQFGCPNVAVNTTGGLEIYLGLNNPKFFIESVRKQRF